MEPAGVLDSRFISLGQELSTGDQVLSSISRMIAGSGPLAGIHQSAIQEALMQRESLGSTALGHGVALPHCRMKDAAGFAAGVLTTRREIGFGSPDGHGVRIFAFVIGPDHDPSSHLEILSFLSGMLRIPGNRRAILKAVSPVEVMDAARGFRSARTGTLPDIGTNLKMIHVFTRCREAFNGVMDVMASGGHSTAMIIEAERADSYLASIPVFAGFWNTGGERFGRIIVTVVHEGLANQLLRKLEFSCGSDHSDSILITVTDVQQAMGSLTPHRC